MWDVTRFPISGLRLDASSRSNSLVSIRKVNMERRQSERRSRRQREQVPVITLKQRTHLAAFILVICQYAMVDTLNVLPVGITVWCCSFAIAMELLVTATARHNQHEEYISRAQQRYMNTRYETALFEYRVLKQSNKKIVIVQENGRPSAIVAID